MSREEMNIDETSIKSKLLNIFNFDLHTKLSSYMVGYKTEIFKITIFNTVYSLTGVMVALITKSFIDNALTGDYKLAIRFGIILAIVLLLQIGGSSYLSYCSVRLTESMRNRIQIELLSEIYSKNWLDLNTYKTGDLLLRLYSDIGSVVTALTYTLPKLFALIIQVVVAFALVFFYSPLLAVLTFLVTPVTILIGLIIGHKLKAVQKKIQEADALKSAIINESLQNIIILKSFNFLSKNLEKVKVLQAAHYKLIKQRNTISIKSNVMLSLGYQIGFFAAIFYGTYSLAFLGITVGTFTAFIQLVYQIQSPIQGLAYSVPQFISSLSSVERIEELRNLEDDGHVDDDSYVGLVPKAIVIKEVSFSYIDEKPILIDLEMTLNRGEKIAIIGPSGEGKTTIILLLLALIKPNHGELAMLTTSGEIFVMSVSTRRYFSYVPQVNALFSGSIYDNFLLTSEVSDEALEYALVAACCKDFIDELPMGLNTLMGERGVGLSQGQAQRITIARALLHETPFLIFDEATSALDLETERKLIENIKTYYPECTLIAVTHREGLFDICDHVYRLKNGRLSIEV